MTSLVVVLDHVFVPLTIIIAITSVIGFLGNALAFYIFRFRFSPTGFNILMATLAVYDMLACAIHMPLDIATFYDIGPLRSYLCKVTCFQLAFTATGAALILMSVAFVRFMGIYRPLEPSFSTRSAYYVIVISVLLSSGIGLPITILFGDGELETDANITARICAVESKFMSTSGPISYYFILASLYIITFVCHTCLYTKSVLIIWKRRQTFVTMKGNKNVVMMSPSPQRGLNRCQPSQPNQGSASPSLARSANPDVIRHTFDSPSPTIPQRTGAGSPSNDRGDQSEMQILSQTREDQAESSTRGHNSTSSPGVPPRKNKNLKSSTSNNTTTSTTTPVPLPRSLPSAITNGTGVSPNRSSSRGRNNTINNAATATIQNSYRILGVVMAISVTYFLSYAPHFGVMFYLFTHDKAVFTASAQSLVFELLMRSFFLNNILDPVIYGLLSQDFRHQALKVLCSFSINKT